MYIIYPSAITESQDRDRDLNKDGVTECNLEGRNPSDDAKSLSCTCISKSEVPCFTRERQPSGKRSFSHRSFDGKKPKLRTSKDVYNRLIWDSRSVVLKASKNSAEYSKEIDTNSVYIGYKDRFLGMCELPFHDYEPGGDIPFHRVYYFRTGGPPVLPFVGKDGEVKVREDNIPTDAVFVWDRESRTDLIFNSGNSTSRLRK